MKNNKIDHNEMKDLYLKYQKHGINAIEPHQITDELIYSILVNDPISYKGIVEYCSKELYYIIVLMTYKRSDIEGAELKLCHKIYKEEPISPNMCQFIMESYRIINNHKLKYKIPDFFTYINNEDSWSFLNFYEEDTISLIALAQLLSVNPHTPYIILITMEEFLKGLEAFLTDKSNIYRVIDIIKKTS